MALTAVMPVTVALVIVMSFTRSSKPVTSSEKVAVTVKGVMPFNAAGAPESVTVGGVASGIGVIVLINTVFVTPDRAYS